MTLMPLQALTLVTTLFISGCATIVSKSSYPVTLNSMPSGASFVITGKSGETVFNGRTPSTVTLKSGSGYFRKASYTVKFSSAGYGEREYPIEFKLNGWYFGNIIFGGVIGMLIVDPATGAMWSLPKSFSSIYARLSPSTSMNPPSLNILSIHDLPQTVQKELVPLR